MFDTSDPYDMFLSVMAEQTPCHGRMNIEGNESSQFVQNKNMKTELSKGDYGRMIYLTDYAIIEEDNGEEHQQICRGKPGSDFHSNSSSEVANFADNRESISSFDIVQGEIQFVNDSTKDCNRQEESECLIKFADQQIEGESVMKCTVCNKPALRYSSYGGQICSSCRSFFHRSVKSAKYPAYKCKQDQNGKTEPGTRKNCKYCRFQSCIRSGLKITWVLSDQERNRRFTKLKRKKRKEENWSLTYTSVICFAFSDQEEKILEDLNVKFQVPWLQNLLMHDRDAGVNLIEYVYGEGRLKFETWKAYLNSVSLNFVKFILPSFTELDDLSPHDLGQIMNSPSSGIAHYFISLYCTNIGSASCGNICTEPCLGVCAAPSELKLLSKDLDSVASLDLPALLSRIDLSKEASDTRKPAYGDLYPDNWAGDREAEGSHREAACKIVNWPTDDNNVYEYWMVGLMTLILAFNADFYTLDNKDRLERIQLKYIMILQRCLRSKLPPEAANTKFLEGMMLIAQTRQAWDIAQVTKPPQSSSTASVQAASSTSTSKASLKVAVQVDTTPTHDKAVQVGSPLHHHAAGQDSTHLLHPGAFHHHHLAGAPPHLQNQHLQPQHHVADAFCPEDEYAARPSSQVLDLDMMKQMLAKKNESFMWNLRSPSSKQ